MVSCQNIKIEEITPVWKEVSCRVNARPVNRKPWHQNFLFFFCLFSDKMPLCLFWSFRLYLVSNNVTILCRIYFLHNIPIPFLQLVTTLWPVVHLTQSFPKSSYVIGHTFSSCPKLGGITHCLGYVFLLFLPSTYISNIHNCLLCTYTSFKLNLYSTLPSKYSHLKASRQLPVP